MGVAATEKRLNAAPESVVHLLSAGGSREQSPQWGGDLQAGAFQDHVVVGRLLDTVVHAQREGKVLTIAQQLVTQVRT